MANIRTLLDVEDARLTAPERHQLRQILIRLQGGVVVQPETPRQVPDDLAEAISEVFGKKV